GPLSTNRLWTSPASRSENRWMREPIFHVDAFTPRPFAGNPAAVCVLVGPQTEAWMQSVAGEMNLPETAFLRREDGGWSLRWFTRAVEADLGGHATLASAHVLWGEGYAEEGSRLVFRTKSGELSASRSGSRIELDFPAEPASRCEVSGEVLAALGIRA